MDNFNYDYMNNFNPALDVQPFASKESPVKIESFIRKKKPEETEEDNLKVHSCEISIKVPQNINEEDIMEYIMGIKQALGVKVLSYKWAEEEGKKNNR